MPEKIGAGAGSYPGEPADDSRSVSPGQDVARDFLPDILGLPSRWQRPLAAAESEYHRDCYPTSHAVAASAQTRPRESLLQFHARLSSKALPTGLPGMKTDEAPAAPAPADRDWQSDCPS